MKFKFRCGSVVAATMMLAGSPITLAAPDSTSPVDAYQQAVEAQRQFSWQAHSASGTLRINHTLLAEMGVSTLGKAESGPDGHYRYFDVVPAVGDALSFIAPFASWELNPACPT